MKKFTCGHCGQRIAVAGRRLHGLVTCPECGRETHPLAEQIVAAHVPPAAPAGDTTPNPSEPPRAACANCGRTIGRLQKLNLWHNDIVCAGCYETLAAEAGRAEAAQEAKAKAANATGARPKNGRKALPATAVAEPQTDARSADVLPAVAAVAGTALAKAAGRAIVNGAAELSRSREAGGLRVIPLQLQLRTRILAVLLACCLAGVAIYGALALLKELAGLLTTLALIVLAAVATYLIVRAAFIAGKAALRRRGFVVSSDAKDVQSDAPPAEISAKITEVEAVVVKPESQS